MKTRSFVALASAGAVLTVTPVGPASGAPNRSLDAVLDGAPDAAHPYCATEGLTRAEIAAGATSEVRCFATFEQSLDSVGLSTRSVRSGDGLVGIHYDGASGSGSPLAVAGTSCDGGGTHFEPTDWWNNRISSTRHKLCSKVKHLTEDDYTGNTYTTEGGDGVVRNLNATLDNAASSIVYLAPAN